MTKCIKVPNGIITLCETDFKCPRCGYVYHEEDYYSQLDKSKRGLIYKHCKGCKTLIGITTDIRGDVRVWLKSEERNFKGVTYI